MTDRLVSRRLFWQVPVSGVNVSGIKVSGPQSSAIDLRIGVNRLEAILFIASSVASNPDVSFQYAISPDNVTFGSYADNSSLLTSTVSLANPQGWQTIPLPLPLAPFIKFLVSSVASNPTDTVVTADLLLRMTQ